MSYASASDSGSTSGAPAPARTWTIAAALQPATRMAAATRRRRFAAARSSGSACTPLPHRDEEPALGAELPRPGELLEHVLERPVVLGGLEQRGALERRRSDRRGRVGPQERDPA